MGESGLAEQKENDIEKGKEEERRVGNVDGEGTRIVSGSVDEMASSVYEPRLPAQAVIPVCLSWPLPVEEEAPQSRRRYIDDERREDQGAKKWKEPPPPTYLTNPHLTF